MEASWLLFRSSCHDAVLSLCACLYGSYSCLFWSKTEVDVQCQDTDGQRVYSLLLFPNRDALWSMEYIPRKGVVTVPLYYVWSTDLLNT